MVSGPERLRQRGWTIVASHKRDLSVRGQLQKWFWLSADKRGMVGVSMPPGQDSLA
jgi:hypothetical protein